MDQLPKLAAFIRYNMPQNRKGILTAQQAYDVAAYVSAQPRPKLNPAYAGF
jgi:thiosulfate dehydrogenase